MHELSIVTDLVALAERSLADALAKQGKDIGAPDAPKIREMWLKIGRLSGVETHYLKTCYDTFRAGTVCAEAELMLQSQEVVAHCDECGYEGEITQNSFICPQCGSRSLRVTDGEDMYLMRLVIE